ncbi:MAG: hypothetical protein IPP78_08240 [Holophagaceae bacterium]|nr:hypothetical protein [Holophagaceae bacterium]
MLLFYIFYYVLSTALLFQGLHIASEVTDPLGTVPEEVGQTPNSSLGWGSFLVAYGTLCIVIALLSHAYEYFVSALRPLMGIGLAVLAVFGAWVVFKGRTVKYLGEAATDPGHHGHLGHSDDAHA